MAGGGNQPAVGVAIAPPPDPRAVRVAAAYGHLLGGALANVLPKSANASQPYTTADQLLAAWYGALYTVGQGRPCGGGVG